MGRNPELSRLEKWLLDDSRQRLAIVGLGGVGKTQLAHAFCHIIKHKYPKYSIFWVSALSWTRFQQDFSKISQCSSTLSHAEKENALLLAKEYLQSEVSGDWLLVVDNADDTDLFRNSQDSITSYMPNNERGKILFTTRHKDAVVDVAEWNVLDLMQMSMEEAKLFLEKILGRQAILQNETATTEVLTELTCLPLAIVQASSYMVTKSVSIPRYLAIMRSTNDEIIKLLSNDFKDNTRDETSSNALATTWLVSFKQIQRDNPHAADMLFCAALLENKAIPLTLLPSIESNVDLADTVGTLLGYSFFTKHEKEGFYNMHRLVHHAVKICVPHNDKTKQQMDNLIDRLASVFPIDDWENRVVWHAYLPHAVRVLQDTRNVPSERRADLCESIAICLWRDGIYPEAITWISECLSWRQQWLLEIDARRLRAQHHLAGIHLDNGDVKQAIRLLERVVKIKESSSTEDDPARLESICELARSYRAADEFKKGIELLKHVHRIEQKFHAKDYSQILLSQLGLGSLYLDDGQIKKAVEMLENVVRIGEKVLEEDHPLRLSSQHELARVYLENSETGRAIELYQHVVRVRENVLIAEHPKLLASQHELARAYLEVSEIKKAVELLEHVVRVQNKALLEDHPGRLRSEHCLGVAYLDDGQSSRAFSLLEDVVKTRQHTLPADHHQRLFCEQELARAYYEDNQLDKALALMEAVVAIHRLNLAVDDSIRLNAEAWLPVMYNAKEG